MPLFLSAGSQVEVVYEGEIWQFGCEIIIVIIIFVIFVEVLHMPLLFIQYTCYGYGGVTSKFTFCPLLQTYSQTQFFVLSFGQKTWF